jgi:3-hydroxypropionyl-coenzyme A dehydratase
LGYTIVEQRDKISIIKINRPEARNAVNYELVTQLKEDFAEAESNEKVSVVIITGEGHDSFSAGGDIKYVSTLNPNEAIQYSTHVHGLLNQIEELNKPVIAAINGYALGGGCQISLACDIRYATMKSKLGQPEVKLGICPGWGGTQRLARLIGVSRAKELIFTGKIIDATEAFRINLINKVIYINEDEQENMNFKEESLKVALNERLIDECIILAETMTKRDSNALKMLKSLTNKVRDTNISTGTYLERLAFFSYLFSNNSYRPNWSESKKDNNA